MSKVRHYLASANTGAGFVDYFDSILEQNGRGYCYIIKGGSGTGKSTMLSKIATHFAGKGELIEYFHCSSDYQSLDGVRIVGRNVSVIDGTPPHAKEASLPSVTAEIVNVGAFIGCGVAKHRKLLQSLGEKKKKNYAQIYDYLGVCKQLENINYSLFARTHNKAEFNAKANAVINSLRLKKQKSRGGERHLFLEFIGENGISSTYDLNAYDNVLVLDFNAFDFALFADKLRTLLTAFNYNFITFYSIVSGKVASIYIADLDLFIRAEGNTKNALIRFNNKTQKQILTKVAKLLKTTKKLHKNMEKCYIPNVDFAGVNALTSELIAKIENHTK